MFFSLTGLQSINVSSAQSWQTGNSRFRLLLPWLWVLPLVSRTVWRSHWPDCRSAFILCWFTREHMSTEILTHEAGLFNECLRGQPSFSVTRICLPPYCKSVCKETDSLSLLTRQLSESTHLPFATSVCVCVCEDLCGNFPGALAASVLYDR